VGELFNKWINLKVDIQMLAGIVQNPLEEYPITKENLKEWEASLKEFNEKLYRLEITTIMILNYFTIHGKHPDNEIKEIPNSEDSIFKEAYYKTLKSGMFFEFYPSLTGVWEKDKEEWSKDKPKEIQEAIQK